MRAREIHTTAEQLAGEPLRWTSVKAALAADSLGSKARFERVRRGCYRIRAISEGRGSRI
jgi:predicted transcriptional regulator of viral defense system